MSKRPRLLPPPAESPVPERYPAYARVYTRGSGETSIFMGHESWEEAADDAASLLGSRSIRSVSIRGVEPGGTLGPILWFTGDDPRVPANR